MCNKTAWLPGVQKSESVFDDSFRTWILGIFTDNERPTTAELSLPIAFDGHYFTDFGKRIMLLTGDGDSGIGRRIDGDNGDDTVEPVDITIRRR